MGGTEIALWGPRMKNLTRSISSVVLLSTLVIPLAFGSECIERGDTVPFENRFSALSDELAPAEDSELKKVFDQYCVATPELKTTTVVGQDGKEMTLWESEIDQSMAAASIDRGNGTKSSHTYIELDRLTERCLNQVNLIPTAHARYEKDAIIFISGKQSDDVVEYVILRPQLGEDEIEFLTESGQAYGLRQDDFLLKRTGSYFPDGS